MKKKIEGGVHLLIDPSVDRWELFAKFEEAITERISAVQILDHWEQCTDQKQIIEWLCKMCHQCSVPVLINNNISLLEEYPLDGIHLDKIPSDLNLLSQLYQGSFIKGVTCHNDLSVVIWATQNKFDYVSFYPVLLSSVMGHEDPVLSISISNARKLASCPIFLSGGILPDNMEMLADLDYDGVAVRSGIMGSHRPANEIKRYLEMLRRIEKTDV